MNKNKKRFKLKNKKGMWFYGKMIQCKTTQKNLFKKKGGEN